ncbi:uncharacterized protein LOC116846712 [Odontomachus brunneus]|uniref:uncharacterized protein LOC116846712 n=1 Tax=Odontomachus brunneus TaxID=486640 RepID=UPI0013F22586|nr:uncharacterized protein LOC116846712 [Odontomachus brunneus]
MPMRLSALPKAFGVKDSVAKGRRLAEELTKNAGIVIPEEGYGILEIERFQQLLSLENIAIVVYNFKSFGRGVSPLYDGHSPLASHSPIAKKRGYVVTEKWECIFDRELRKNREIREFVENHPMLRNNPFEPREAFYGGRTENIVTRYEVTGTEKIRYVDVCSLYPYVLKTGAFPLGHPDIYVGEECCALIRAGLDFNFDAVEGLVRCRVLAPRDLFHPVLPYRVNGKLLFAFCRSCCETFSQAACTHDDPADREFEGAWVRQEASGWPNECANDEGGKERYLREYEIVEGLNRANISPNPGLRSVAKLCLNSFWGKFGQRSNLPNTEIVRTWESFTALLTSPEHEIINVLPVNDEVIYVSWRMRREAVTPSPLTSVAIAAYTTALARLKLYSYLEKLDRRVLYHDTDSCIYLSTGDPDEYEPRTGNFLGDMTNELEISHGPGSYIETFVSTGLKFYAYVRTGKGCAREICKVKGITLNFENSRVLNFSSIKALLLAEEKLKRGEETAEDKTVIKL